MGVGLPLEHCSAACPPHLLQLGSLHRKHRSLPTLPSTQWEGLAMVGDVSHVRALWSPAL